MTTQAKLGEYLLWKDSQAFIVRVNSLLGRTAIIRADPDGALEGTNVTSDELVTMRQVNHNYDMLDSWEPSKLRDLTLQQINNRIATVQAQIDAVTNAATAKTALDSMYADMQKMARIIIWLLKREMNEL
jgi:hypothetical protein